MNATELPHLNLLLDALQTAPSQVNFTMGFVAASEVSDEMVSVLVRIWTAYLDGHGITTIILQLREELL